MLLAALFILTNCTAESPPPHELAAATSALASPIYLRPTDDATVVSLTHANTNYGADPTLQVDNLDSEGGIERSFLRFAIGNVAGRIGRARLRLEVLAPSSDTADVYKTPSASWTEETITWNNQPGIGTAPRVASMPSTTAGSLVYLDVTSAVAPNSVVSFALVPRSSDNADFTSKEHPTGRRPSLILDNITACIPPVSTPTALNHCPAAPLPQSPREVTSEMTRVTPGVTVTQLTSNGWNNIAYYDIPAVVAGSNRFVYSRVRAEGANDTATMTLDGTDARLLTDEDASSPNTFVTPDGAMAYFPRKLPDGRVGLMAMNLNGSTCSPSPISELYLLSPAGFPTGGEFVPQLSPASRSCSIDKWVIAFATDAQVHRIKGKGAGSLWASMGDVALSDPYSHEPFHRLRLSPTCPNILMYSRNRSTDGKGRKDIYLADLDRGGPPYYLGYGQDAFDAGLTSFRKIPSHEMWSNDGLRVSYTQAVGNDHEPRRLVIGDILNPDCTFRTVNPDGTSNLEGTSGIAGRTFKGRVLNNWDDGDGHSYVPKFCSWSADDDLFACSGYKLVPAPDAGFVEGPSAIFVMNPSTGYMRFLTTTDEQPGQHPYHGQSHLQFAGNKTTILFDSDRSGMPAQVYKVTYPESMLPLP
ncbi:CBM96 family carbohydrate-binding protein [Pyxidicoccus xibeiensis]|uniref:CBM96 family carbohydrate-binding protein n=1 Tax=Pyxidicoccus xibeiensis TaxID=2906759 RepID=UPI0020A80D16|nr:DNRLRE domain-containing protein [Pyxidicoccus xibeiensis]MCP3141812.1 DNRLRE domain-containing protein [Pyxidicoccus xibeiensis]